MNKAFIFDRSGTLNDNFHSFCQVVERIFSDLGKNPISSDEIRKTFTLPYMRFRNAHLPELSKEEQDKLYKKHIHTVDSAEIYTGVFDVLYRLYEKGRKLFVVSSDNLSTLIPEIHKAGLDGIFSKVIGEVHEKKEALASLVKDFELDSQHTYYVGDTSGDVEAGKRAGVNTVGIARGYQHKDGLALSKPDFLIETIDQIRDIV